MLAADVSMQEIDGAHWANWLGLLVPPRVRDGARWALVFLDGDRVIKVIIAGPGQDLAGSSRDEDDPATGDDDPATGDDDPATGDDDRDASGPTAAAGFTGAVGAVGAVDPASVPYAGTSQPALRKLARALDVDFVAVLDRDAPAQIHHEIDSKLSIDDDFVAQCLTVWRAVKHLHDRGVWTEPRVLDLAPAVSYTALQKTFDLLIPDNTALVAYAIEDDASDIHASMIAVKRGGDITRVTTHQAIADAIDPRAFARDWRAGHVQLLRVITDRFARPSLAVFFQRRTFYRVMTGPPDQLAREINTRDVIIDPAPAWLLGLLSGATMAAMATRGARALAGFLPSSARKMASDLAHTAQAVIRDSGAHPFALLGFDPIELWHNVRHFYEPMD